MPQYLRQLRWWLVLVTLAGLAMWSPEVESAGQKVSPPKAPNTSLTLDISDRLSALQELSQEEQNEQLADWALWGLIADGAIDSDHLAKLAFDHPPTRDPFLRGVFDFQYGKGRSKVLNAHTSWILYEEDDPERDRTLGHRADELRLQLSEIPQQIEIYRYKGDLLGGQIYITLEERLPGADLFSERYGYYEAIVTDIEGLGRFLEKADDLSLIKPSGSGLRLGGRRDPQATKKWMSVDDVAALYQAHQAVHGPADALMRQVDIAEQLPEELNHLINLANQCLQAEGTLQALLPAMSFKEATAAYLDKLKVLTDQPALLAQIGQMADRIPVPTRASFDEDSRFFKDLETLTHKLAEQPGARGLILPPSNGIGFSLDPQWDLPGLVSDLQLLRQRPKQLLALARTDVEEARLRGYPADGTPNQVATAQSVVEGVDLRRLRRSGIMMTLDPVLAQIERDAYNTDPLAANEGGLDSYYELVKATGEQAGSVAGADELLALLRYIDSRRQIQCARYDGPLQGTQVGMTLFYTDLMAKVWASVDYYRSAPTWQVPGFLTDPRTSPDLEATYWDEILRLPSTRLWFGPREEGYLALGHKARDGLLFAPLTARVYSAGSDPTDPGKEEQTAEGSRRVFDWWNRHYQSMADYETQYHRLNQIMKWSIVTGWLQANSQFKSLLSVKVKHDQQFDRWMSAKSELRFQKDVRLLPQSEWIGNTECMERLRSYPFPSGSGHATITGGVSLGGRGSVTAARAGKGSDLPPALRRSHLDQSASSPTQVKSVLGPTFDFETVKATTSGGAAPMAVKVKPGPNTLFRSGAVEMSPGSLRPEYQVGPEGLSVTLDAEVGTLNRLTISPSQGSLALRMANGPAYTDQASLSILTQAHGRERPIKALLADTDLVAIAPNATLLEIQGQALVMLNHGPQSVLVGPTSHTLMAGTTPLMVRSVAQVAPEVFGAQPRLVELGSRSLEAQSKALLLDKAQTLVLVPGARRTSPGEPVPHFLTDSVPRGQKIELHLSDGSVLSGAAGQNGEVALLRPSHMSGDSLADLARREGLDDGTITRLYADVISGRNMSFQTPRAAGAPPLPAPTIDTLASRPLSAASPKVARFKNQVSAGDIKDHKGLALVHHGAVDRLELDLGTRQTAFLRMAQNTQLHRDLTRAMREGTITEAYVAQDVTYADLRGWLAPPDVSPPGVRPPRGPVPHAISPGLGQHQVLMAQVMPTGLGQPQAPVAQVTSTGARRPLELVIIDDLIFASTPPDVLRNGGDLYVATRLASPASTRIPTLVGGVSLGTNLLLQAVMDPDTGDYLRRLMDSGWMGPNATKRLIIRYQDAEDCGDDNNQRPCPEKR